MDTVVACSTSRHAQVWWWELQEVPGPWKPLGICTKSMCIISSTKIIKVMQWRVDNDNSTPLAHWSLEKYKFMPPADLWFGSRDYQLTQPLQTLSLHKGPSTLDGESPTTDPWWASPFGGECVGALAGDGAPGYLPRWGSSHGWYAPSNLVEVTVHQDWQNPPWQTHHSCSRITATIITAHNTWAHPRWLPNGSLQHRSTCSHW